MSRVIVVALVALLLALPGHALPSQDTSMSCPPQKRIDVWNSAAQLETYGFHVDLFGDQGTLTYAGQQLSLDLAADPLDSQMNAARITEIDTLAPVAQRSKCWQTTPTKDIVVEFKIRFDQPIALYGLTENQFLWNAPFPNKQVNPNDSAIPATAIGVSRNSIFGAPQYMAIVAQDLDLSRGTVAVLNLVPLAVAAPWLNAGWWHTVRITISETGARIDIAQGLHPFTTVLNTALAHPVEPLGFEFSIDNETEPGTTFPILTRDGLDVAYLHMDLVDR
jgi:hypothetical protein